MSYEIKEIRIHIAKEAKNQRNNVLTNLRGIHLAVAPIARTVSP